MQQMYSCPNCNSPVAFGTRFCGNCGNQLTWQQQTPPPPIYQQPVNFQQQQYGRNGQQMKRKRGYTWLIVLCTIVVFIVLVSVIVGVSGGKPSTSLPTDIEIPTIAINAEQLCQAYDVNEVAADAMYKDKILKVSGVVDKIGRDVLLDYPQVELHGAEYGVRRYVVQCTFSKQSEYLVAQLSQGQSVTIQGTCDGREKFMYIISLKNCTITETPSTTPTTPAKQSPNAIEISAVQLCQAYKANEVAADAKYKDNVLKVTGAVFKIGKGISGPYVLLDGGELGLWQVDCEFSAQDEPALSQLSQGQPLVIQGRCSGLTLSYVDVKNCTIIK